MPLHARFPWWSLLLLFVLGASCSKGADFRSDPPAAEMMAGPGFGGGALEQAEPDPPGGQPTTWRRSTLSAHASRIMVGEREAIELSRAEIRTRIDGFRARVMLDLFFDNRYGEGLEGTFQLRLPEGASPYFLAFGQARAATDPSILRIASDQPDGFEPAGAMAAREPLWIAPREAVMAERERAAVAYGNTVRRRVDPALLEWAGAGVFNARIFPLSRGMHRVVVGYDVDLTRVGDDLELLLALPSSIETLVDLDVATASGESIEIAPATTGDVAEGRTHFQLEQPRSDRVVVRVVGAAPAWLTGKDPMAGEFFATRVTPSLPKEPGESGPDSAIFMLDTSLSSNPERFEIWRALTRSILERDREHIQRFAVMTFSIDTGWWKPGWVANTPQNVEALMQFAQSVTLEGATDLGAALAEAAAPAWLDGPTPRTTFMLGDGAATWGSGDVFSMTRTWREAGAGPLFVYDTGIEGGSRDTLDKLARETGGARFSVVGESELAAAAVAHRSAPWELEGVSVPGGRDVMIEGRPRALYPGQRLTLVGRGRPEAGAAVELRLRQGSRTRTVRATVGNAITSDLAPRRYAQIAVDQLEELVVATRPDAVAYARHFRITGRTCSLVMLETDEDYINADIGGRDDATVVMARPASQLVDDALERIGARLGDPKVELMALLRRLEDMPGVMASLPAEVAEYLAARPSSAFALEPERLSCDPRRSASLLPQLSEQLRSREPEYDLVVADARRRLEAQDAACALVGLSSVVEASPGDAVLARDVAFTAAGWGLPGQAARLLVRVAESRPHEPLTYHVLAQTLAEIGETDLAIAYYEIGLAGDWDARFGELRKILLLEYLRLLDAETGTGARAEFARRRRDPLRRELGLDQADLVVTIMWNTDNTDVDLHVREPRGGHCYYGNPTTRRGKLTADVTQGYGPEMFVAKKSQRGRYRLEARYFASDRNRMSAPTKIYATIIEGYGTPTERVTRKTVTLRQDEDTLDIATVATR